MRSFKTKACQVCGKEYQPTIGVQKYCKECGPVVEAEKARKQHATYYDSHRVEAAVYNVGYWRRNGLQMRHGLTQDQYDALFASQDGKCAVCGEALVSNSAGNKNGQTCIDHDHKTGRVRGLLCTCCNLALGFAHDDPERLLQLHNYLKNG